MKLPHWMRPRGGEGSRAWDYDCPAAVRVHRCEEPAGHGWQHRCSCGFRFAAAVEAA